MKCDNCKKEQQWLEVIGNNFICHRCINRHKIMGNLMRTHMNTFRGVVKKLEIKNYEEFMKIDRKLLETLVDFKKIGIKLKTTNIVEID